MTLVVKPGRPPFAVNSSVKVENLNADKLDGLSSAAFASSTSEGWHYIGDPGEPAFQNSWVNFNASVVHTSATTAAHAAYRIDANGVVHLRGVVKSGTIDLPMFTLPAGYRPFFDKRFPIASDEVYSQLFVAFGGSVHAQTGSNVEISLDGVYFQRAGLDELDAALP